MANKQEEKKTNSYYNISKRDFNTAVIDIFNLNDGRMLYALKYGKNKENLAIIALATTETTDGKTQNELIRYMRRLILNPGMRDINNIKTIEETYGKKGFAWTHEGKEIFSQGSQLDDDFLKTVVQTVKYNSYKRAIENVDYDLSEADKCRRLEQLKTYLEKLSVDEQKKFKEGADNIFRRANLNMNKMPENINDAKKILEQLEKIEGFDKASLIKFMKEEENKEPYEEYLQIKETSLIREKWKYFGDLSKNIETEKSNQLTEYLNINQEIDEYVLTDGKLPENFDSKEDKKAKTNALLELSEVKQEGLFIKEVNVLLATADRLNTKLINENSEQIKYFIQVMNQFGFDDELSSKQIEDSYNRSEDEPR